MRTLTLSELSQVGAGYYGQFDIPDPVFNPKVPVLPDVNPPKPDPSWILNPINFIPISEPALPKIGKP